MEDDCCVGGCGVGGFGICLGEDDFGELRFFGEVLGMCGFGLWFIF